MAADENASFIREVNEDIRQERMARLWKLLKPYIIGGALAIILATIAFEVYSSYSNRKGQRLGDAFTEAHQLAQDGHDAEASAKLAEIEKSGYGGYPMLAEFRAASLLAQKGDKAAAVRAFDRITAKGDFPQAWRDLAAVRAAYILVDTGTAADVEQRVHSLDNDASPMRFAAREALGLACWKAGNLPRAAAYFNRNYSDEESRNYGFGERAAMMAGLISSESPVNSAKAVKPREKKPEVFMPDDMPGFVKAPLRTQSVLSPAVKAGGAAVSGDAGKDGAGKDGGNAERDNPAAGKKAE